ncbi:MAG: glycosyltransferase family 2 protein [Acidobacteria bacterium]|nr:glycosyltransferase family 2 protein [Acidobacteriota bacterium]
MHVNNILVSQMTFALIIFWICVAVIFYGYIGYPSLMFLIGLVRPKQWKRAEYRPTISIIITARNEERDIHHKLENTLEIDYPSEKLEIMVVSDCSTDRTDEVVMRFSDRNIRLIRQEPRLGKTSAQNLAVDAASGEIILFSDATTIYQPNVLKMILQNFADKSIGCVTGRLLYRTSKESSVGIGSVTYWSYETFLKEQESRVCSLIGTSGCLYAVRKSAYVPMYPEACSDFLIATLLYRQGLRTIYEPEAVCFEEANFEGKKEFAMRTRVIAQTFTDLWRNRDMMNPGKSGFFAIELISHKLLRYFIPLFLTCLLLSTAWLALHSHLFLVFLLLQIGLYLTAVIGGLMEIRRVRSNIFSIPYYFLLTNLASVFGFYKFLRGERYAYWDPMRPKA